MISSLNRHRSLSFILGGAASLYLLASTRIVLWKTTLQVAESLPGSENVVRDAQVIQEVPDVLFGPEARLRLIRKWNRMVDSIAKPVIKALVDRDL